MFWVALCTQSHQFRHHARVSCKSEPFYRWRVLSAWLFLNSAFFVLTCLSLFAGSCKCTRACQHVVATGSKQPASPGDFPQPAHTFVTIYVELHTKTGWCVGWKGLLFHQDNWSHEPFDGTSAWVSFEGMWKKEGREDLRVSAVAPCFSSSLFRLDLATSTVLIFLLLWLWMLF